MSKKQEYNNTELFNDDYIKQKKDELKENELLLKMTYYGTVLAMGKIDCGEKKDDRVVVFKGSQLRKRSDEKEDAIALAYKDDIAKDREKYKSKKMISEDEKRLLEDISFPSINSATTFINYVTSTGAKTSSVQCLINDKWMSTKDAIKLGFNIGHKGAHQKESTLKTLKGNSLQVANQSVINKPHNRIIFGAPGTGKSHILEEERAEFGERYERVTFHPDYTYAHFVGTYKPVMVKNEETGKNEIEYKFVAGPFLRAYVAAKKSETPFLLIIEEINRANVAAVFGDVFQLLDRKEDGVSEYEVTASLDVQKYLKEEQGITDFEKLCLPKNMYIWATMNSADQGVFPMDTAFKRRWHFEYMDLDEGAKKIETWTNGEKWNDFRVAINKKLIDEAHVNEDKCMGPFFLTKTEIEKWGKSEFADIFKSKILMYLFEDAAKQKRSSIFSDKANTFSRLCKAFDDNEAFRDNQLNQMVKSTPAGDEDGEVNDGASDVE